MPPLGSRCNAGLGTRNVAAGCRVCGGSCQHLTLVSIGNKFHHQSPFDWSAQTGVSSECRQHWQTRYEWNESLRSSFSTVDQVSHPVLLYRLRLCCFSLQLFFWNCLIRSCVLCSCDTVMSVPILRRCWHDSSLVAGLAGKIPLFLCCLVFSPRNCL
jgi:hypothetical protein